MLEDFKSRIPKMLNITRCKRSVRKRRNSIVLPLETLTHVLHYFPRKQLVEKICLVNSRFFHVANQLLPNLHIISDNNIRYWPPIAESEFPQKLNIHTFQGIILCNGPPNPNRFGKLIDQIKSYGLGKRIGAGELRKNFPQWYVRFPRFEIRGVPDEALLKFLRRAKKNFINCRLSFTDRAVSGEEFFRKVRELLTDTFLDAGEILITTLHNNMPIYDGPERFFDTYGVQNCDKVAAWYRYDSQAKESFKKWLSWKRDQPGSRRHLVLFHYTHSVELVADLKQAFQTAKKPLHYVVTFISCHVGELTSSDCTFFNPGEFHLGNESTGERLSMFQHRVSKRLWRRSVKSDDSAWLSALTEAPNRIVPEGFDKKFYDAESPILDLETFLSC
ncbi:hypothetical protein Ddc_15293 [Ditylenchus destructor]|nr:hypothetical protein Ddc_15293 [Ditylenchus destructor]